ncbi:MAG: hypothetical protein QOI09_1070 [Chloroflexota bacterium]|nr:hypothetical protein [Chloroflexota bacterium]
MSEQWPQFGSDQANVETEATGSSSANGANPEPAVDVLDRPADETAATQSESADESPAAAELTAESPASDATATEATDAASGSEATDEIAATSSEPASAADAVAAEASDSVAAATTDDGATTTTEDGVAAASADEGSAFVSQLVHAMQTTAALERVRIGEDIERRRQSHIEQVRSRQATEADRMRELAGDDLKAIQAWADGEASRIELERERRATALQKDLEISLVEHGSKIDREIEGVEMAIATYRAHVDAFFEGLDHETDPILIAQQAARRPIFPTLDALVETVSASAAAPAETRTSSEAEPPASTGDGGPAAPAAGASEPPWVGVMDPETAAAPVEAWTAPPEKTPEPASAGASDGGEEGAAQGSAEPVGVAVGPSDDGNTSLFESIAVLRPMAWLRRETNGGERSAREG